MKNRIVKLGRRLNALPGNMENMAAEAVTASARRAAASARNMVPVDSGELKNSIAAENTHRLAAVVSAGAAHAAMERACVNPNIGYDQIENQTLWNHVKDKDFDPASVSKPVETDCARLVRVCVQYACEKVGNGRNIPDFYTATLKDVLRKTGLFEVLTADQYNRQDDYLLRGDIQVTKTKGHTWIILENGSKSGAEVKPAEEEERVLQSGMEGEDVRRMQQLLLDLGYELPRYGADGEFGSETLSALKKLQADMGVPVTGMYDAVTRDALAARSEKKVQVTAAKSANVRTGPGTQYPSVGVVHRGDVFPLRQVADNGWRGIEVKERLVWISPKMSGEI